MRPRSKNHAFAKGAQGIVAAVLVALLLVLLWFNHPGWHSRIHPDSTSPEHSCFITHFTHGWILLGAISISFIFHRPFEKGFPRIFHPVLPGFEYYRFLPERAPPC